MIRVPLTKFHIPTRVSLTIFEILIKAALQIFLILILNKYDSDSDNLNNAPKFLSGYP